ncbi:LacI family DNA-binding transcriptional regulator [Brooklawnia cerclae]
MAAHQRVTIDDVARRAGVSTATVSKYLANRDYYIAEGTRRRIREAITELDYLPNAAARALAKQRSQMIGVVVPSIVNPYYPEVIAGIEDVTEAAGYTLSLATTNDSPERESAVLASMRQQRVAGMVLGRAPRDEDLARIAGTGIDTVLVSRESVGTDIDRVQVDSVAGATMATQHLIEHGHRRIAHIGGPQDAYSFKQRAQAYRDTCTRAGLDYIDLEVHNRYPTMADGADACRRLLEKHSPTAVFVANDLMAMGVLDHCNRNGIRVPDDLAVVGFDNVWVAGLPNVELTTIDASARLIGQTAATILLRRFEANDSEAPDATGATSTVIPPRLVTRRTCGCD